MKKSTLGWLIFAILLFGTDCFFVGAKVAGKDYLDNSWVRLALYGAIDILMFAWVILKISEEILQLKAKNLKLEAKLPTQASEAE